MPEASDVVANRAGRYGHPRDNFQTIADFWITYIRRRYGVDLPIEPQDVGQFMVLVKVAREANTHEPDSLVDIEGYARCSRMILGEAE